ncbi:MAG TPA: hypothetical protein VHN37_05720 [Actinomycetota bacterium]|nr:hypothetical protein [Actinomycetota bacterium]
MATPPEIQESRNVNTTQIALVAGGVLLLLVVLWFAFLRGGDEEPAVEGAPAPPPVDAEPLVPIDTGTGKGPGNGKGPVETFEVFAPKDPFKPLITPETDAEEDTSPPAGDVDADGDGQADTGTDTGTGDGTGTGTGTDDGTGGGDGGETVGGHRVSLVDVFRGEDGPRAQVQVDGTVYTVDEGEQFAQSFQLLSINGECATMLYGDDQFTLCEGEEIVK